MTKPAKTFKKLFEAARKRLAYHVEGVILEFTEEVASRMEAQGISNAELADRLNASPAYVTKVLRGTTNFTLETMVKIARALDADVRVHLQPQGSKTQWFDVGQAAEQQREVVLPQAKDWANERYRMVDVTPRLTGAPEVPNEELTLAA